LNSSIFGHFFVLLTRRDDDHLLSESVVWKALVVDAGSVMVGLILLRLEVEVPEVDPDVKAVILVISL
jgi:hypothetical protein